MEVAQNQTLSYLSSDTLSPYYMRQEGDLLYYYFMASVFVLVAAFCLFCFFGSFMFMGGSLVALMMVDEGLSKMVPEHESKKDKEEAEQRAAAQAAGRGGSGPDVFREEFKND